MQTKVRNESKTYSYRTPRWYWVVVGILVVIIAASAVPAFHQKAEAPGIVDFFPKVLFGDGTFYTFNRITMIRIIVAVVLCVFFAVMAYRARIVPTRGQVAFEAIADFPRKNIVIENLGEINGRKFAPLIGALFVTIAAMNLTGVIPGLNIAASSVMAVPLVLAIIAYVSFVGGGIRAQGFFHFFKSQLVPPGVPVVLAPLIILIEFFSTFVIRPATLAIRLLCNMMSGHLMLAMTFWGTSTLLAAAPALKGLAIITGAAAILVTLFEVFIALLQAFIFCVLTTVYIKLSVESH